MAASSAASSVMQVDALDVPSDDEKSKRQFVRVECLHVLEPTVLNQTVLITLGKAPHQMQCHGLLVTMARKSSWVGEVLKRHLDEGEAGRDQLRCLHVAQELVFDTPAKREALERVWNHMHSLGASVLGFDYERWAHYCARVMVEKRQHLQNRPRGAFIRNSFVAPAPPPIKPVARDAWLYRFELLQHLRVLIDYFDLPGMDTNLRWIEWVKDLAQTCPFPSLDDPVRRELADFMRHHLVTRMKQRGAPFCGYFAEAIALFERRCIQPGCQDPIAVSLLAYWEKSNGMRLTQRGLRTRITRNKMHVCEEHLHTHQAHRVSEVYSILRGVLDTSDPTSIHDTVFLDLPRADAPSTIRRITATCHSAAAATPVVMIDNYPGDPRRNAATTTNYTRLSDQEACSSLDRELQRFCRRAEYPFRVIYKLHPNAQHAAAAIDVDEEEEDEEGDEDEDEDEEEQDVEEDVGPDPEPVEEGNDSDA
jgi:hypothetical protein